jgi:hypothetical protein
MLSGMSMSSSLFMSFSSSGYTWRLSSTCVFVLVFYFPAEDGYGCLNSYSQIDYLFHDLH